MKAQKRGRGIRKADECLIPNEESQELLARSHVRYLRNLMRRKYQLSAYLELVNIHIERGTIPPGLCVDITPPGYSQAICHGFSEWTVKTTRCSQDLILLLKKRYVRDLKRLEQLMKSSTSQLTTIFCSLKGISRKSARLEVADLVCRVAQDSNRALLQSFDKAADKYVLSEESYLEVPEANTLHVSAGTSRRATEDKDMIGERTRSLSRLSLDSKKTYDNIYPERNSYDSYGFRSGDGNGNYFGTSKFSGRFSRNETFSSYTKSRIEAEEEEMKYLEFINSVTNDILTRGVYSDRVLTQVMERHLIRNKGQLDEGRMRHMLTKLQHDLGVSANPMEDNSVDSKDYTMRYEPYDSDHYHSTDCKERSYSSVASAESFHRFTSNQEKMADGDGSVPKPKKRGILKTGGGSSGDEKEKDNKVQNQLNLTLDQPDPLIATMKMSGNTEKDSKTTDRHSTLPKRSSNIDKDLADALSLKSNSAHSLGSLHSVGTSSHGNDLDDLLL